MSRILKVGDTIWDFDGKPRVIVGETSKSWLLESQQKWLAQPKVPKKYPELGKMWSQWFFEAEVRDATMFLREHRYSVQRAVAAIDDGMLLRKVADLVGWKEPNK